MDLVVATSRGRSLEHYFKHRWSAHLIWRSGASIKSLVKEADKFLKHHRGNSRPHHIFFVAGLPDLTERKRGKSYEEVIFEETPEEALIRMKNAITSAQESIQENHNAKTCFATITPISLKTWNNHRLSTRKTSILKYEAQYESMQDNLIQATVDINKYIISSNNKNGMPTPRLAKKIIKKSGKFRQTPRVYYAKLPDGVHPNENTAEEWINIISLTILEAKRPDLFCNGFYIGNSEHFKPSEHLPNITSAHLPQLPATRTKEASSDDEESDTLKRQWRTY